MGGGLGEYTRTRVVNQNFKKYIMILYFLFVEEPAEIVPSISSLQQWVFNSLIWFYLWKWPWSTLSTLLWLFWGLFWVVLGTENTISCFAVVLFFVIVLCLLLSLSGSGNIIRWIHLSSVNCSLISWICHQWKKDNEFLCHFLNQNRYKKSTMSNFSYKNLC